MQKCFLDFLVATHHFTTLKSTGEGLACPHTLYSPSDFFVGLRIAYPIEHCQRSRAKKGSLMNCRQLLMVEESRKPTRKTKMSAFDTVWGFEGSLAKSIWKTR